MPGRLIPPSLLALVAVAVFAGSLGNGFVFDDVPQVLQNGWIRDLGHLDEIFANHVWAFAGRESSYYRPLMHVVYALLHVAFGPSPVAFHAANLVVHAGATVLLFALIRRWVHGEGPAFLGALIFAVHPVHVEAVAWVSGLPDVASSMLVLLGLLASERALERDGAAVLPHAGAAVCLLTAALFKEPGLALAGVVLACDVARRPVAKPLAWWLTRYGAMVASLAVYTAARVTALGGALPGSAESGVTMARALEVAGAAIWRYVAMLLAPHPLNAFQTLRSATGLPPSVALVLAPAVLALAVWRRSVAASAAAALFLVPLLPALYAPALLPGLDNPWAERYAYLPVAALSVALAAATRRTGGRAVVAATLGLAVLLSAMTLARTRVWRDDLTLWTDTVGKSPDAGVAHAALAHARFARGEVAAAVAGYEHAIRLEPDHADSHLNLGVALATLGRHDAALAPYATAARLQPRRAVTRANLAISLSMLGRHADALSEARRAVTLQPELAKAHYALGIALGNAGAVPEAARAFRRAVELDPSDPRNREMLGRAEAALGRPR